MAAAIGIRHSTIAFNTADSNGDGDGRGGGGIYVDSGVAKLEHTIVANNTRFDASIDEDIAADPGASFFSFHDSYGLIEAIAVGTPLMATNTIIGLDPMLGKLADNGGPTLTHALRPGSVAIDRGDPTLVAGAKGTPKHDQRGFPYRRISGARIDIGAFESQPLPGDFDLDGDADGDDLAIWDASYGVNGDADADGDGQSSGTDFLIWQLMSSQPAATPLSSAIVVASDSPTNASIKPRLVDLALAVELIGGAANSPVHPTANRLAAGAVDEVFQRSDFVGPLATPAKSQLSMFSRHLLDGQYGANMSMESSDASLEAELLEVSFALL